MSEDNSNNGTPNQPRNVVVITPEQLAKLSSDQPVYVLVAQPSDDVQKLLQSSTSTSNSKANSSMTEKTEAVPTSQDKSESITSSSTVSASNVTSDVPLSGLSNAALMSLASELKQQVLLQKQNQPPLPPETCVIPTSDINMQLACQSITSTAPQTLIPPVPTSSTFQQFQNPIYVMPPFPYFQSLPPYAPNLMPNFRLPFPPPPPHFPPFSNSESVRISSQPIMSLPNMNQPPPPIYSLPQAISTQAKDTINKNQDTTSKHSFKSPLKKQRSPKKQQRSPSNYPHSQRNKKFEQGPRESRSSHYRGIGGKLRSERGETSSSKQEEEIKPDNYKFVGCTKFSYDPKHFIKDEESGCAFASEHMKRLEDRFQREVLKRRPDALKGQVKWQPLDRTAPLLPSKGEGGEKGPSTSSSDSDSSSGSSSSSDSSDYETTKRGKARALGKKQQARGKKKTVPLKKQKFSNAAKKATAENDKNEDSSPRMIRNIAIRTAYHQREVEHKLAHPQKLHQDLWYNEENEYNDGPACTCKDKYRIGPLHNQFEGEKVIPLCNPESNNADRLFHYRITITPTVNFHLKNPTVIKHKDKSYTFNGYSFFTHFKIEALPPCQVLRNNMIYFLDCVEEDFPETITVRSLDMITDFIYTELLELVDFKWRGQGITEGCRIFHVLPRFVCDLSDGARELLSPSAILNYLLDHSGPLIDFIDLASIHKMQEKEWSRYIDGLRGTLVTHPGKKPAAIRVDQLDRRSAEQETPENVLIYPMVVHISYSPIKMCLTRNPKYKRTAKDILRLRYLMMNKSRITTEDRNHLKALESKLEKMENNRTQRREVTVEISSDGFHKTGLKADITQFALILPSFFSHVRFHKSLDTLEERISYVFKDKTHLHQALTHPSFRRANFGTNQDHVQNSMVNCGHRYLIYGNRLALFKEWRKQGLTQMIKIMSNMPSDQEERSNIYGNERLEFLGDAVIEIISSVHLYFLFPHMSEGHLDAYRQALVQNQHLAKLAIRLGIHRFLLYTHSVDFSMDTTFTHARSDAFEALMAAIALDGGLDVADRIFSAVLFGDDKSVLGVWCKPPLHQLQAQCPEGDRHWLDKSAMLMKLTELEESLGIQFKHIRLLARALTVRKTGFNVFTLGDNQRLEFLGDSLLKYTSTDYLYRHFPHHHEGHLSLLKNSLVNKYTQADVCFELGLDKFVIKQPDPTAKRNHDQNIKYHADLLEAFVGALFVDKDLTWVERFCQVCFWPRLVEFILNQEWNDPKSKLQQCCLTLRALNEEPEIAQYKMLDHTGPTNRRIYQTGVYFRGERLATGSGRSVKQAEMDAAQKALEKHYGDFPQLKFQRSIIQKRYNEDFIQNMLQQVSSADAQLVDKFVPARDGPTADTQVTSATSLVPSVKEAPPQKPMTGTLADLMRLRQKPGTSSS